MNKMRCVADEILMRHGQGSHIVRDSKTGHGARDSALGIEAERSAGGTSETRTRSSLSLHVNVSHFTPTFPLTSIGRP